MYSKCGELSSAKRFFEQMVVKDDVSWNSIISGCCQCGEREQALSLFKLMRAEGVEPGLVTWNILIASYCKSGYLNIATELTKEMENYGIAADVFTWTSLISGFAQNDRENEALNLFQKMRLLGVEPNGITVSSAISACASLKSLTHGRELHSYAVKIGCVNAVLVGNSLVDMYAKCGRLEDARKVFEKMPAKDVFSWNSMIGGYTQAGYCGKAFELFCKMERFGVRRNVVTWNAMISGYVQNGDEDQAMELFQRMEIEGVKRNTASWNALIAGSVHNGHLDKALRIFRQMQSASMRPNSVTILSIIPACANVILAWKVREIHASILNYDLQNNTSVANALIDTYAKSGNMASAKAVFDGLKLRDLISWNSIIGACVMHGHSHSARNLFLEMKMEGMKPNHATFASMIIACGLEGNVNQAQDLLSTMENEYQLMRRLEHYTAIVGLYGRSGGLREASDLVENMSIVPDIAFWDAFFTAARIYENIRLANLAAENLFKLEPRNPRIHRLLSHIQALCGKSYSLSKVRKPKKARKFDDSYGCSWLEVRNKVYCFFNGVSYDLEKYNQFKTMIDDFKPVLTDRGNSRLDFEEEKEEVGDIHSEKKAIAFGIINSPKFTNIRIMKSVRMCTHCHTFAKLISKQYDRDMFIKDPKCLHHFKDGKCSCRDYW
uniref:DYW domain-containing protein n=1 Tax=Ananas comosus var. bracteatus TaxID=296719 RepID=A0A6V7P2W5_ANACO|nr:unnamed protein product [Ananas comosus var. bracteatus]